MHNIIADTRAPYRTAKIKSDFTIPLEWNDQKITDRILAVLTNEFHSVKWVADRIIYDDTNTRGTLQKLVGRGKVESVKDGHSRLYRLAVS